ncbi:TetR/AcrR family transcriptional regulator [Mycobacterium stomatepiae]|uniref:TetR family transcriptional regulator n=1 Tax=Mycobacterium stomatepiae TaxID=470076 RepID=A0A7I7Q212_9MYCO|nr:TetR/AcrR family transcriptional regulator [Mycobacterium stomatepiae]MCV7166368.1 TetR/AcrR family transcriptional regulator [Mycobacterium stomatepiae]BBY20037.1 TetR family transcriptional regulator [Mycobacterium stomatepiae]
MSLKSRGGPQRRRGRALEEALLDSAWEELTERGYDAFTVDGAAARAGTSRAVLYRRWSSKQELVVATLAYVAGKDVVVAPDTGSLRGDVVGLLQQANKVRIGLAVQVFMQLGSLYRETGTSLADLSAFVRGGRDTAMEQAIQRAVDRGEIDRERVTERIARLPADLWRHEILTTLQPLHDEAIEEIVDTIFLPLVGAQTPASPP